ncbi:MAG: class I SAM-dependent methyltransferase [Phycisphaerae bacterium]|nr:class I SAM-dependent methyltransferase [Phycisphaerae bacterium]
MRWWQRYFGSDDYLLLEGRPTSESADQFASVVCRLLRLGPGSRVLDAGCGLGYYSAALARRGCVVTAIDALEYMVDHCGRLGAGQANLIVEQIDFHEMSFRGVFDAVICAGHSLGYGTRDEDVRALGRFAESLAPGGAVLVELHNPPWYVEHVAGRTWWEEDSAFVLTDISFDEDGRRMVTRDVIVPRDGSPAREYAMSLRQYEPPEIGAILAGLGLTQIAFFGDNRAQAAGPTYRPGALSDESQVMIVTARRP